MSRSPIAEHEVDAALAPFVRDLSSDQLARIGAALREPLAQLRHELEQAEAALDISQDKAAIHAVFALVAAHQAVADAVTAAT